MKSILPAFALVVSLLAMSCSEKKTASSEEKTQEINPIETTELTIGLMPAVDTAPIFLAQDLGYFDDLGLNLTIEIFTNAQDRQSALQSGTIDGAMTDLVALAVNISGGFDIKATTLTDGMFPLLAVPGASNKKDLKVGMMEISVSNFLVDQWIVPDYNVNKVFINSIPARLEAVVSGQLDMGLFPEPIATVGTFRGLEKLIFEAPGGFSPDVMVFTGKALNTKGEALKRFHRGYDRAAAAIQSDEGLARDILIKSIPNLKPELRDKMTLPEYHSARLPDDEYLNSIINWTGTMVDHPLNVTPGMMVDSRFLKQ